MPARILTPSPDTTQPGDPQQPAVLSYFALRRFAGYIGFALPVIVVFYGCCIHGCIPTSISASYYTGVRNAFVGSLCAIGIFLIASIGYKRDYFPSLLAGTSAIVVAFCPTSPRDCAYPGSHEPFFWSHCVHMIAAATLFLTFAWFCLVLFTRTGEDPNGYRPLFSGLHGRKKLRNGVYITCGTGMLVAMAVYALHTPIKHLFPKLPAAPHLLLCVEWICLWLFGTAWLVKGQQLFADQEPHPHPK